LLYGIKKRSAFPLTLGMSGTLNPTTNEQGQGRPPPGVFCLHDQKKHCG